MTVEMIGLREAARRSGRNKGMLHQAMKAGKLPYTLDANGIRRIDPSELQRLFPGKHEAKPRPIKKRKHYKYPPVRLADAAALQQRIADGQATPDEAREYDRIIRELRRKFENGMLSPQSARQFGIE